MITRRAIIIIPARLHSTRLPQKMLFDLLGVPLVVRTYRQAIQSKLAEDVIIACDDKSILKTVEKFNCKAILTPKSLKSGSDRLAFATRKLNLKQEVIVNVQGDEPLIDPRSIDFAIHPMLTMDMMPDCTTLYTPFFSYSKEYKDSNTVKCVIRRDGYALYFSRSPLPFFRTGIGELTQKETAFRHIGLYAYKRETLLEFTRLKPSRLEMAESLEQLRLLENGFKIFCVKTPYPSQAVDTLNDAQKVLKILKAKKEKR
ncbi:MAG: 3-deoxy-manno-octulosonate cytidylyltransferase [Chloroherpetonaceae bacterium]|nr:3-deoxy-manno-octulosonate cytidylyltransferase [Chloroherpetonaceae bacterium]